jgi:hypothetical protein
MPRTATRIAIAALIALAIAQAGASQPVIEGVEIIDFDRPEAWAMKRSASLTLFTGLGPPRDREAGDVELGLGLGWNPSLSEDEMRVGFNGTKVEDMGRLDVVPRLRVTVGLGRKTSLDLSYTPPITVEGLEPQLFAVAVERPVWRSGGWVLGVRAIGQIGEVAGDITCPVDEAAIPPGDPGNDFGCEEPSSDVVTVNYVGIGLTGGYELPGSNGKAFHFGVFANYMDLEFQVDALTYGFRDRARLVTDGWTWAATGGFSFPLGRPTRLAFELFYSPLDVDRPVFDDDGFEIGIESRNDALFNIRAMFTYVF